jgi:hypothetical protein
MDKVTANLSSSPMRLQHAVAVVVRQRVELIAETAKDVEQWRKKGFFGKWMMRCASLSSAAQSAKV